ncbi:MAG: hypothetical protein U0414_35250 [Polyangiaceae bacterium]
MPGKPVLVTTQDEQKYLLLKVPDFATDIAGDPSDPNSPHRSRYGEPMTSYLRLGAASLDREPGDELVPYAFMAGPAGTVSTYDGDPSEFWDDPDALKKYTAFIDDERNRGLGNVEPTGAGGHGMTIEQRRRLHSDHLMARGGWRDHSDGNRITTTYGDKVEVIRGNYKLVVLGRQDDGGNAIGHDMTGNHLQDYAQATMPGASVTVEWIQNGYVPPAPVPLVDAKCSDPAHPTAPPAPTADTERYTGGAWLLINSTERVYQYSRNAGNFREQIWGDINETYIGSENPERVGTTPCAGYLGHPVTDGATHQIGEPTVKPEFVDRVRPSSIGLPRGNPIIIEKTWASRIEGYTGSPAWRIPSIHEETWAVSVKSVTDVNGSVEEKSHIVGPVTSTSVHVGNTSETTTTTGNTVSTTTINGNVLETTTNVGTVTEISTIGGVKTSVETLADVHEFSTAGLKTDVSLSVGSAEVSITGIAAEVGITGGKLAVDVTGAIAEITVALAKLTAEVNIIYLELYTGIHYTFEASKGAKYTPDGEEVAITKKTTTGTNNVTCVSYKIN